jgi:hypothetical protein
MEFRPQWNMSENYYEQHNGNEHHSNELSDHYGQYESYSNTNEGSNGIKQVYQEQSYTPSLF